MATDNPSLSDVGSSFLSGLINTASGTVSKVADTAVDNWTNQGAGVNVGTVYPTGQVSTEAAAAPDGVNSQAAAQAAARLKQYALWGGIGLAVVFLGVAILSRSR